MAKLCISRLKNAGTTQLPCLHQQLLTNLAHHQRQSHSRHILTQNQDTYHQN